MYDPPPVDDNAEKSRGTFSHPFFGPTRHIAPFNWNVDCNNMSVVITDFFIALKSI